ncbi:putative cytochrome b5-like heme/steroid binding domain-containing protein [Plasmopara halstedii]
MAETDDTCESPAPAAAAQEFTLEDVAPHNTAEDCWMVIREDSVRKVYNVTAFLDDHPGGPEIMVDVAGQDATDEFEDIGHSNDARMQLKLYEIGKIKGDVKKEAMATATSTSGSKVSAGGRQDISDRNGPMYVVLAVVVALTAFYFKYN